jgi:asparagine synthase (glutamine-hydrolysing)
MGGLAGIYQLDDRPADTALLARLVQRVAHRGPDGSGQWTRGGIAIGHRALNTTPESVFESQPFFCERRGLVLVLDGRIDNREELYAALGREERPLSTLGDAELVLRAYARWGEECPAQIIGDFAFAIWDEKAGLLFCARDFLGMKPFYYACRDSTLLFGSEPQQLFESPCVTSEPNEGMVAEFLSGCVRNNGETLYRDIQRLPPSHVLIVRHGRVQIRPYQAIDPHREIRYRRPEEYAEHLSDLLRQAVRARLRCSGRVGVLLSGGVDSSAVCAIAGDLSRASESTSPVEAFSLRFPGLPCDEVAYSDEVIRHTGVPATTLIPDTSIVAPYADEAEKFRDLPDYPNGIVLHPARREARARGVRALLTGMGGDEWFTGGSFHRYVDQLREGHWKRLVTEVKRDINDFGTSQVLKGGLRPLTPPAGMRVWRAWQHWRGRSFPPWVRPELAARVFLTERLLPLEPPRFRRTSAAQAYYGAVLDGWSVHAREIEERSTSAHGLESRHPLQDRRLAQFALAIPDEQFTEERRYKAVLRNAVGGLLPESVRLRRSKSEFSCLYTKAFDAVGQERALAAPEASSRGWIDVEGARLGYREAKRTGRLLSSVWMVFAIDLWCRKACNRAA